MATLPVLDLKTVFVPVHPDVYMYLKDLSLIIVRGGGASKLEIL